MSHKDFGYNVYPGMLHASDLASTIAPLLLRLWALTVKNPGNLADHHFSESEFNYYH